ncbi:MAG TPA: TIGR00730 family Rossman fold protein [Povalibacter sp.]|uniref:LOG family protein n=1 Tax=Povalibacter sp. TaxID=1962978 RepID=UPI002D1D225D|nr:TIGR00730 family Rossman fold protein [Povalibacter sp.]HMN44248.1 TIGR00730 family Rossman fold protein [Povalibacter sp.]
MKSLCVFCGSNAGNHPRYLETARTLGTLLARRHCTLVYGGGRVGLMGAVADAALQEGGRVVGVIPQLLLDKEVGHAGLTELHVVQTMAQRKQLMGDLSDAFLTLPGGIGTMDELFEAWTWTQLDLHRKPCGLLNQAGYYDPLIAFIERCQAEGFLRPRHASGLLIDSELEPLVERLAAAC